MKYMDKLHVEPVSWLDLFDFLSYTDTETEIEDYLRLIKQKEQ